MAARRQRVRVRALRPLAERHAAWDAHGTANGTARSKARDPRPHSRVGCRVQLRSDQALVDERRLQRRRPVTRGDQCLDECARRVRGERLGRGALPAPVYGGRRVVAGQRVGREPRERGRVFAGAPLARGDAPTDQLVATGRRVHAVEKRARVHPRRRRERAVLDGRVELRDVTRHRRGVQHERGRAAHRVRPGRPPHEVQSLVERVSGGVRAVVGPKQREHAIARNPAPPARGENREQE